MSPAWDNLLLRINREKDGGAFTRIQALLIQNDLRPVGPEPLFTSAAALRGIWPIRARVTTITGVSIPGVEMLIKNLRKMSPDKQVEQYGFTGGKLAGSIYFDPQTKEFLGDTIVELRPKNRKMLDLEEKLGITSSKTA